MNPENLQALAATNQWGLLWPEIAVALLGCLILALDLVISPAQRQRWTPTLAVLGLLGIFAFFLSSLGQPGSWVTTGAFGGLVEQSIFSQMMRIFFLLVSVPVAYLGLLYLEKHDLPRSEFFCLMCLATAAMMLLVQASNFVLFFVALETVTITFYVLVSYCRYSPFSLEAGLKYVILGAFSSAILLFGMVLLYGAAGDVSLPGATGDGLNFAALGNFIAQNAELPLVRVGAVLVLAGLAFKISAVPFHVWAPDVYQGAPTPVTAFLAVGSKAAGFAILANVVSGPLAALSDITTPLLSALATITILYGNFAALGQTNLKRLMALSGIAHAGYMLLAVAALSAGVASAEWALVFYLITYLLGSFTVFGVMSLVSGVRDEAQELSDYRRLARQQPFLGAVLTIGLASLAGIPPLAGFMGKLLLFIAALKAGLFVPLIAAGVGVAASIYYYFGWIRQAIFEDDDIDAAPTLPEIRLEHKFAVGVLAFAALVLGVVQGGWGGAL